MKCHCGETVTAHFDDLPKEVAELHKRLCCICFDSVLLSDFREDEEELPEWACVECAESVA